MKYFRIISSFLLKLFGEERFVKSVKVFPASIKSINPIQKYLQVFMFLLSMSLLISLGICSTPKESK